MKLTELEFQRAGYFTALPPIAIHERVTVVLGDNEAGKSTALRALEALLFGPTRDLVAPLAREAEFRMSARAKLPDGSEVRITRRGRTLEVTPESAALAALLAPQHASRFRDLFRIGHGEVRADAAFLSQDGALGRLLFAATSGADVNALSKLEQRLEKRLKEAKTGASGLPKRVVAYEEYRRRLSLSAGFSQYDREQEECDRHAARVEAARREIDQCEAALKRLMSLRDGIGQFEKRNAAKARLDAIRLHGPTPDTKWAERASALLVRLEDVAKRVAAATDSCDQLTSSLDALPPAPACAPFHAEAAELSAEITGIQEREKALASIRDELATRTRELTDLLESLGSADAQDPVRRAESLTASAPLRSRLDALLAQHDKLEAALEQKSEAARAAEHAWNEAEAEFATHPPKPDESLALAMRLVASLEEKEREASKLRSERAKTERDIARHTASLKLTDRESTSIPSLPVADPSVLKATWTTLQNALTAERDAQKAERDLAKKLDEKRGELAELQRLLGAPPSAEDLAAARAMRREAWERLESQWSPSLGADAGERLPALAEVFAQRVEQADAVVDRRFADAERIGRWEATRQSAAQAETDLRHASEQCRAVRAIRIEAQLAWARHWEFLPEPPDAWEVWLATLAQIRDALESLAKTNQALEDLELAANALRTDIAAASQTDAPAVASLSSTRAFAAELEREANQRSTHNKHAQKLKASVDVHRKALTRARNERDDVVAKRTEWQREWEVAARDVPAGVGPEPHGVRAWLAKQKTLEDLVVAVRAGSEQERKHVEAIDRFASNVTDLLARIRSIDPGVHVPDALGRIETVREITRITKDAAARGDAREKAASKRDEAERGRRALASELEKLRREMRDQCAAGGLDPAAPASDVQAAIERSKHAAAQNSELNAAQSLLEFAWPMGETAAVTEIAARSEGELSDAIVEIENVLAARKREHADAVGDLRSAKDKLGALERTAGAEDVAQQEANARTLVLSRAEEIVRLQVAQWLLGEARKRATEGAAPLIEAASAWFAELTDGAYTGLEIERNEKEPTLIAFPAVGSSKLASQLSDGTLDQIWLALRLAVVAEASRETPFPLLLDDVLVSYDDQRTRAAIRVLERISSDAQVILFTHHDHVAHLARATLGEGMALVVLGRPELRAPVAAESIARPVGPVVELDDAPSERLDLDRACTIVIDTLRSAGEPLAKAQLIERVRAHSGMDVEAVWASVINRLKDDHRIAQTGEKRGARYSLPG